jgi:hypothetical protein
MSLKSIGAFGQFPRLFTATAGTANGGTLTAPTNTVLLGPAGPDGTDLIQLAAIASVSQTSANLVNLYQSPDGGTTLLPLPLQASFAASAAAGTVANFTFPNAVPIGPQNPLELQGIRGAFTHTLAQSALTESANWYVGVGEGGGTANAQALAAIYNTAGTQLSATPATGTIVDYTPGVTNTTTTTVKLGLAGSGVAINRVGSSTGLSANDLLAHNPYRMYFDGTEWILLITYRLYIGVSVSQAVHVTGWGFDR